MTITSLPSAAIPLCSIFDKLARGEELAYDDAGMHLYFDSGTCRMERLAPTIRGLYLFLYATMTEREIHFDTLPLELFRINLMHHIPLEARHLADLIAVAPAVERIVSDLCATDKKILAADIALARYRDSLRHKEAA